MKSVQTLIIMLLVFMLEVQAQKVVTRNGQPSIWSGPMIGYTEHREVCIWLQLSAPCEVTIEYHPLASKAQVMQVTEQALPDRLIKQPIVKCVLDGLEPGTTYSYRILINKKPYEMLYPLQFTTRVLWEWRMDPPAFSFITGSCLYINDSAYDRPGKPYGQGTGILKTMANTQSDIMLWLGDNLYTREVDYSSSYGLSYRYETTRRHPDMQQLLASKIHYAIWDDHDYGPNDAAKSYPLKQISRKLFMNYWANKTYGEGDEGIYSTFTYTDAQFFLLDDRWYRDDNDWSDTLTRMKTQLGSQQLEWLKQSLLNSKSTFKFICIGGQFLNEYTDKESYQFYKTERKLILDFIVANKISGVVFLSGDRHHTELLVNQDVKQTLGYSLYELTSSALSSGPNTKPEINNPMRVSGTLVTVNNFCKLSISGKRKERILEIQCLDKNGLILWTHQIAESALRAAP